MFFIFLFLLISLFSQISGQLNNYYLSDEFINSLNSKQSTWTAKRNFPLNITIDYLKSIGKMTLQYKENFFKRSNFTLEKLYDENYPETFDSRKNWKKCKNIIDTIIDQGQCNSCWAIAPVNVMSDRICIHSNGKKQVHLSIQDVISCCTDCAPNGACKAGYSENVWEFWKNRGIVTGGNYGYNEGCKAYTFPPSYDKSSDIDIIPETPECKTTCDNGSPMESQLSFANSQYNVPSNENAMIREIYFNGPIQATILIYTDFIYYHEGVYQKTEGDLLGIHSVRIIGWGKKQNVKYWLCANSWGQNWGKKGYIKILRGSNHIGIEEKCYAGLPKL